MLKGLKLKTKIMLLPAISTVVLVAVIMVMIAAIHTKVIVTAHEKLRGDLAMGAALLNETYQGEWSIKDGKLFKGETQMNGNFTLVDKIGSLAGDTVTIFQGDTRIATNVKDASGNRAVGTKASAAVIDAVLTKGQTYTGKANVMGNWNQTAYEPIRDSRGKTIGMFYVGVPNDQYDKVVEEISMIAGLSGSLGLLIVFTLGYFLYRSITHPIERVAGGLMAGSEEVAAAAGQVSSSSQSLAEGASEQAATIEETSSVFEEVSSMTKQNAESARQADALMSETKQAVSMANECMGRLTRSMKEIFQTSEQTSNIIKTIDEIAFQTNLLALNAAVEAARAGEAGAGFAVVADEVRNLAMRAAEAARNTDELIKGTVKKVGEGMDLVDTTNEAFQQVGASSIKVADLVVEIAAASAEQALGIEQVNKNIAEMDRVAQQNAANAEESASASEELDAHAGQMREMVLELETLVGGAAAKVSSSGRRRSPAEKAGAGGTGA